MPASSPHNRHQNTARASRRDGVTRTTTAAVALCLWLGPQDASAQARLSGEVGVDVGATFSAEGARTDTSGNSSLLLGAEVDWSRVSLSVALGVPIMPGMTLQAPVRLRWHSRSPRGSGWFGSAGVRPVMWSLVGVCADSADAADCPVQKPAPDERPQRVFGALGSVGVGGQWAHNGWLLRGEVAYLGGYQRGVTSSLGPALSGYYQGVLFNFGVAFW